MIKIHLSVFPHSNPPEAIVDWAVCPQRGDFIYYKSVLYAVTSVQHNIDNQKIKVLIMSAT